MLEGVQLKCTRAAQHARTGETAYRQHNMGKTIDRGNMADQQRDIGAGTVKTATPQQGHERQMVCVNQLDKTVQDSTGNLQILHGIDFKVQAGETVAIVGASGSGKSTLLSILAGLDTPTAGTVHLNGQNLFALDEDARAAWRGQQAGFVFQSFQLLDNLTALENVMLPLELVQAPNIRQRASDMLQRVGLGQRLQHYPKVLSGGEQQRVALARAFVTQPAVLFADEPTGSLDFATGEQVMQLMLELNRQQGTTLIMVTHDRAIAAQCDRRLRMEAGYLQEEQTSSA